jgi:quercetin dioxygenase-like cupin family protein
MVTEEREVPVKENLKRPPSLWRQYVKEQNVPIVNGVGLPNLDDLPLGKWEALGGRGCFLELDGMEGVTSMWATEVPSGGSVKPMKGLFEQLVFVQEGRGTTEVWKEGSNRKQTFEWQRGTLFAIPMNSWFQYVNAASSPALLLTLSTAPFVMDMFQNRDFVFNNNYNFSDRYPDQDDYFNVKGIERDPESGRAIRYSNVIPDLYGSDLPLDGQRGPGYRFFSIEMTGNILNAHLAQFPSGRYSKAHAHYAGAVLICLAGKGYSITWPCEYGTRPWEQGLGDHVMRQDYTPGGLVSPGSGWFHAHYSVGAEPLRLLALRYGSSLRTAAFIEAQTHGNANLDIKKGGRTIEYRDEDPQIRKDYIAAITAEGVEFGMPDELFR